MPMLPQKPHSLWLRICLCHTKPLRMIYKVVNHQLYFKSQLLPKVKLHIEGKKEEEKASG